MLSFTEIAIGRYENQIFLSTPQIREISLNSILIDINPLNLTSISCNMFGCSSGRLITLTMVQVLFVQ